MALFCRLTPKQQMLPFASSPFGFAKRCFMEWPFGSNCELQAVDVYKENAACIVSIGNTRNGSAGRNGSGIIWRAKENIIVTCFHVVKDAALGRVGIRVGLIDNTWHCAQLINGDPIRDIAILRIMDPSINLKPIKPGEATHLDVGENVYAIGRTHGQAHLMSWGVVSGLNKEVFGQHGIKYKNAIQTDCVTRPGGALFDCKGRCVGMCGVSHPHTVNHVNPVELVDETVRRLLVLKGKLFAAKSSRRQV